jgi:hypothetical protein
MYNVRRIAGLLAILSLAAAAWFSILLARADAEFRKGTPEGVARAVELAPRNTAYLSLRALQVDYDGGDMRPLLEEIARMNPAASAPRIRLGLDAEVRGDLAGAERWLLDAARVDRQYEPRWTLANFYFRQPNMDQFWKWMRSALEVSYGDRKAAFDLCSAAAPDTPAILARAIPDRHQVLAAYLTYLLSGNASHAAPGAAAVAERLSQWRDPSDLPVLDVELDALVERGSRAAARQIWINLGYADPTAPVVNPDFGPPHVGHGFDWWLVQNPGVTETPLDTPALRVSFNGMQPESCELLRQYVGIQSGRRYLLRWESRGIASGIAWHAGVVNAPLRASDDWTPGQLAFVATRDSSSIALFYHRPLGEPRAEGSVELRHIAIEAQ